MRAIELQEGQLIVSTDGTETYRVQWVEVLIPDQYVEFTYLNPKTDSVVRVRCSADTDFPVL